MRLTLLSLFLLAVFVGYWSWSGIKGLHQANSLKQPALFTVDQGMPFSAVADQLARKHLISNAFWLRVWVRLNRDGRDIKAGEYEITPGMTTVQVLDEMIAGRVKTWSVQFIEGWTFAEMRRALDDQDKLQHVLKGLPDGKVMAMLGHAGQVPEGLFFPDTYQFERGQTDLSILHRAYQKMQKVLDAEWQRRAQNLPYKTPYQALIMASLVEKETGLASEREKIAGVFVRRLEKGMRLQTDPAVIYGLGRQYQGDLTRKDLTLDTPYNTYRHGGLPPTPIAMPGQGAIHAAMHPEAGKALYFVARGDGSHQFSDTLAEHDKAVRRYQIYHRRRDYRSSPEQESKP